MRMNTTENTTGNLAAARKLAHRADLAQSQADALEALLDIVNTDPRFAILRGSFVAETIGRDAGDMNEAAEDDRTNALGLGFDPDEIR